VLPSSTGTTIEADEGPGSVTGAIEAALKRTIGFEIQLGPFAVAQLRIVGEVVDLTKTSSAQTPRLFVTNTLGNPNDDEGWIPTGPFQFGEDGERLLQLLLFGFLVGLSPRQTAPVPVTSD